MSAIRLFEPVFILPQNSFLEPTLKDIWEETCRHVINCAEFIFDFGRGTAYCITPQELTGTRTVQIGEGNNSFGRKLLQGISLIAVGILFPLGVGLLLVKDFHHNNSVFLLPKPNIIPLTSPDTIVKITNSSTLVIDEEIDENNRQQDTKLEMDPLSERNNNESITLKENAETEILNINESNLDIEVTESTEEIELPFQGIRNVGNSCYISSVIQMIYSQPLLQAQLADFNPDNIDLRTIDGEKHQEIVLALQNAMKAYNEGSEPELDIAIEQIQQTLFKFGCIEKFADPELLEQLDRNILSLQFTTALTANWPPYEEYHLDALLRLNELVEYKKKLEFKAQGEPMEILINVIDILRQHCPLTEKFEAIDIEALPKNTPKIEAFIAIPLEQHPDFSFESGLRQYFTTVLIDNENPVFDFNLTNGSIEKAKTWERKNSLREAPQYFLVQLNRLLPVLNETPYREELCTDCIPIEDKVIDLSDCLAEQQEEGSAKYRLCSVIIQDGTEEGGHYVSLRRNMDGNWYNFNDDTVTPLDEEDLTDFLGAGYIYLMEKVEM